MFKKTYWLFLLIFLLVGVNTLSAQDKITISVKIHSIAIQHPGKTSWLVTFPKDNGSWDLESTIKLAYFNPRKSAEKPKVRISCVLPMKYGGWKVIGIKNINSLNGITFSALIPVQSIRGKPNMVQEEIVFTLPESEESLKQFFAQQDSLELILQKPEK